MAEILSQEEIDALLEVVDDNTDTPIASNSYEELSLKEISEILEISESRISQIHKKLLKKLRERLV